jgi:hypothetical protein
MENSISNSLEAQERKLLWMAEQSRETLFECLGFYIWKSAVVIRRRNNGASHPLNDLMRCLQFCIYISSLNRLIAAVRIPDQAVGALQTDLPLFGSFLFHVCVDDVVLHPLDFLQGFEYCRPGIAGGGEVIGALRCLGQRIK